MMQKDDFAHLPAASPPDVWLVYRTNPAISFWDTKAVSDAMAKFPFTVCFAYTHDETNHVADVLLPDCTDLEGLQLLRIGGTKYVEQFWDHQGFALRDPVGPPQGEAKDFTWISTSLPGVPGCSNLTTPPSIAARPACGCLGRITTSRSIRRSRRRRDHLGRRVSCGECRTDRRRRVARPGLLPRIRPPGETVPAAAMVLYPKLVSAGLRFEQPYQERLFRIGRELERRLHEQGIHWWDRQLEEYEPLRTGAISSDCGKARWSATSTSRIGDYPFWLVTARSMQYSWGGNVGIQLIHEVAGNVAGHGNVVMNRGAADSSASPTAISSRCARRSIEPRAG